jgi:ketosteroid isomerase-like protein
MSRENVEAVRQTIDEFNAGEMGSRFDSLIDERVEYRDELGELDNRDDLRAYLQEFRETLGGLHVQWEDVRDLGDTLLLVVMLGGRGAASGAEVTQRFTAVMTFGEDCCTRWHFYADHKEALAAAGLAD